MSSPTSFEKNEYNLKNHQLEQLYKTEETIKYLTERRNQLIYHIEVNEEMEQKDTSNDIETIKKILIFQKIELKLLNDSLK
jgi:hypothetical protein